MKKIFILFLMIFTFYSCFDNKGDKGKGLDNSYFVVKKISISQYGVKYFITNHSNSFWITDELGKFHPGDTIVFQKKKTNKL